jgi:hypothetical protein
MNDSEKENVKELLAGFMDEQSARQAAEDIEKGDELLRAWPAPQPGETVLAEVNKKMAGAFRRHQAITLQRRFVAVAAVAAAIVLVLAASLRMFDKGPVERTTVKYAAAIPASLWENDDAALDDADVSVLAAEVETIENELSGAAQSDENIGTGGTAVDDLENELIEMSGDFWKG